MSINKSEEEQQVLCILWEQTYNSNGLYQPNSTLTNATVFLLYREVDNSSFILAGKIITLFFLNYVVFSFGKSSLIMRLFGL